MAEDFRIHKQVVAVGDLPTDIMTDVITDLDNQYHVVGFQVILIGQTDNLPQTLKYIIATELTD